MVKSKYYYIVVALVGLGDLSQAGCEVHHRFEGQRCQFNVHRGCNTIYYLSVLLYVEAGCAGGGHIPLASSPTVGGGEGCKTVPRFRRVRMKFVVLLRANYIIPNPDIVTHSDRRRVYLVPGRERVLVRITICCKARLRAFHWPQGCQRTTLL